MSIQAWSLVRWLLSDVFRRVSNIFLVSLIWPIFIKDYQNYDQNIYFIYLKTRSKNKFFGQNFWRLREVIQDGAPLVVVADVHQADDRQDLQG